MQKCKWCGEEIKGWQVEECDRCWELNHRIKISPELAELMLTTLKTREEQK